jgi:CBS domain-containing protein
MKVSDAMSNTPYYCRPGTNLGTATEYMWNGNCGFLPVVSNDGIVIGVITDRDICVACGTRNRLPGSISVGEVMTRKVYSCSPEDDIHIALHKMKEAQVRRLAVIARDGTLAGVISLDDILCRAEPMSLGKLPELTSEEVVRAYKAINQQQVPQAAFKRAATA